jgi:hypothetical protein
MIKALLSLALLPTLFILGKSIITKLFAAKGTSRKRGGGCGTVPRQGIPDLKSKPFPFHPFVISLFPALSLVSENANLLSVDRKVGAIALITLVIDAAIFLLLKPVMRSSERAAAIVTPSLLLFAAYGHVYDILRARFGGTNIRHRHVVPIWGLLELVVVWVSRRGSRILEPYTHFLNVLSASLVGISLAQIYLRRSRPSADHSRPLISLLANPRVPALGPARDIYYIVADSHAGDRALSAIYGYGNRSFTERLLNHGFFVAERSQSNYAMTTLSLASALNMDYLHPSFETNPDSLASLVRVNRSVEENLATQFLKTRGYRSIFLGSGYGVTRKNSLADLDIDCGRIDETTGRFIQSTFLRVIADRYHLLENDKRNRILCTFDQLSLLPDLEGPKFVFAHIASPQTPFLFGADGRAVQPAEIPIELEIEAYIEQLKFIDNKLAALVDRILERSPIEPVIILQADHGPNFAFPGNYRLQPPPAGVVLEKMQILNAYYLPGASREILYDTITPVNTFRLIFNEYFKTELPLLEDRHYYSTLDEPFKFYPLPSLEYPGL